MQFATVHDAGEICEKSGDMEFQWMIKDVKSIMEGDKVYHSRSFYVAGIELRMAAAPADCKKFGKGLSVGACVPKNCKSSKSVDLTLDVKKRDGTDLYKGNFFGPIKPIMFLGRPLLLESQLKYVEDLTVACIMRVYEETTAGHRALSGEFENLSHSQEATAEQKIEVPHTWRI